MHSSQGIIRAVKRVVLLSKGVNMGGYIEQDYQSAQKPGGQLTEFQRGKVTDYLKLVKWIVHRIVERLPRHIDGEDLMHSGVLGLIDAVQRFHWGREREGEEFKAYAECRIRGQVMDELRRQDILPRSTREKVNGYKREVDGLKRLLTREPTDREVCEKMNIDIDTCHKLKAEANGARQISLDDYHSQVDTMEGILRKTLNMINPRTPEGLIHVKEVRETLAEEIDGLSDRERQVISLYYLEEMTLKEIGAVLSITESRVSQIHAQALDRLMTRLKSNFGTDKPDSEDYEV